MNQIVSKLKDFINKLNAAGVPIPLIRLDGKATITGTMVFISFNTALLGQLGKIAGLLGGIDLTQANYLFGICLAAYLGRKMQGNGKDQTLEGKGS
jgi:hypothetical protein